MKANNFLPHLTKKNGREAAKPVKSQWLASETRGNADLQLQQHAIRANYELRGTHTPRSRSGSRSRSRGLSNGEIVGSSSESALARLGSAGGWASGSVSWDDLGVDNTGEPVGDTRDGRRSSPKRKKMQSMRSIRFKDDGAVAIAGGGGGGGGGAPGDRTGGVGWAVMKRKANGGISFVGGGVDRSKARPVGRDALPASGQKLLELVELLLAIDQQAGGERDALVNIVAGATGIARAANAAAAKQAELEYGAARARDDGEDGGSHEGIHLIADLAAELLRDAGRPGTAR